MLQPSAIHFADLCSVGKRSGGRFVRMCNSRSPVGGSARFSSTVMRPRSFPFFRPLIGHFNPLFPALLATERQRPFNFPLPQGLEFELGPCLSKKQNRLYDP